MKDMVRLCFDVDAGEEPRIFRRRAEDSRSGPKQQCMSSLSSSKSSAWVLKE